MKAKMLKIAGVKSEKEFYKKYPTEEAFMAKHGKALKKAQIGSYIGGESGAGFQPMNFQEIYDNVDYGITGSTDEMRKEEELRKAQIKSAQEESGKGGGGGLGDIANVLQSKEFADALTSAAGGARKGKTIKKAQAGDQIEVEEKPGGDFFKQASKYAGPAGKLIEGFQQLKAEKEALKSAQQMQGVSDVVRQAANTRPEETQRRYLRPENIKNTGEEFFPIYGVGTNVLARNGASVGGGEIMNTFAPNTLYDDLGYEPLNDSERYKQFMHGGKMHKAATGLEMFAEAGGGDIASKLLTGITGENAGGNIGGTIGKTAGMFFGPVGSMVGQAAGQLIGTALDRKPQQIKKAKAATEKNIKATALQSGFQGGQAQNSSFMENGGTTSPYEWVSHTWQPQVIATFGEHKVKDLLTPPKDADMLRAGGHLKEYTPPSARAMSTERPDFQMGGELQTHWGGYAESMSQNPYLPDGGETIMFRGQSHDESDGKGNTGIGITYGDNPVEVERGEPAIKMRDGSGGDSSLVVFGNLKIPKLLGDPKAEGKNFKRYVEGLSKNENKQNTLVNKSITEIDEMDVQTPFDRLKFNSLQANVMGGNLKLKDIAQKKMDAAALQTAMNDTIEQFGLKTTDKGNIMAKLGANILKAQTGKDLPKLEQKDYEYLQGLYDVAEREKTGPTVLKFQKEFHRLAKPYAEKVISEEPTTSFGKKMGYPATDIRSNEDKIFGKRTVKYMSALKDAMKSPTPPEKESGLPPITLTTKKSETVPEKEKEGEEPVYPKRPGIINVINEVLPYLRPTDVEDLDPNQLTGEMYALATNQLEPVAAQTIQPQLTIPYDISLQDILNENRASLRSQQRLVGYNPALQSQLGAQEYAANQRVLGEQFRMNQAFKNQIYKENRDKLDQFGLKNLEILDRQYLRQAEAKSKTKATTQAALNSIAAKYAQNKLENRTLQVYENLYNYRFDPRFRATNMNPLVDFEAMIANASPSQIAEYKKALESKSKKSDSGSSKNGSIVRSLKNI
jgi:hypothetical protein